MTTWLITGCSTGLGRALAEAVVSRGDNVVATARDVSSLSELTDLAPDRVLAAGLDVTQRSSITAAVHAAESRFGGIDVLVNNAGYGYRAAVEEAEDDGIRAQFDTNFFGAVDVIRAVLPLLRRQRAGTIVNVSSIGARRCPPGSAFYAASKAALEAMTGSLGKEVGPLGIATIVVEPGGFRTDFAGRSLTGSDVAIADYDETAGPRRKANDDRHGTQRGDPAKAAEAIIAAVTSSAPPAMLVLGPDAVEGFRDSLAALEADLDAWADVGLSTDFDDVA